MITTIQIHDNVKRELDRLKKIRNETYEQIILRLMREVEKQKRQQKELLIEGCRVMAKENIKIMNGFSFADKEIGWEY
ncbi:MAG: hypothetical protein KKE23_03215 [Nanoarchaeota archaeon]|nr:hypothetical protein [Nanoarchaeota archaeon]